MGCDVLSTLQAAHDILGVEMSQVPNFAKVDFADTPVAAGDDARPRRG